MTITPVQHRAPLVETRNRLSDRVAAAWAPLIPRTLGTRLTSEPWNPFKDSLLLPPGPRSNRCEAVVDVAGTD